MTLQSQYFNALSKLIDVKFLRENRFDAVKSEVPGYMDLHIDYLFGNEYNARIALSRYFRTGGDSVADPDMELTVDFVNKTVGALSYQDTFGYRTAEGGPEGRINPAVQRDLDRFLATWLRNLKQQGHGIGAGAIQACNSRTVVETHAGA